MVVSSRPTLRDQAGVKLVRIEGEAGGVIDLPPTAGRIIENAVLETKRLT